MENGFKRYELFDIWFALLSKASHFNGVSKRVKDNSKAEFYKRKALIYLDYAKRIENLIF